MYTVHVKYGCILQKFHNGYPYTLSRDERKSGPSPRPSPPGPYFADHIFSNIFVKPAIVEIAI